MLGSIGTELSGPMLRRKREAETARLAAILGHDGSVDALNDELCDLIRADRIDLNDRALRVHIRQSLADALAINNPKWPTR